MIALIQRVKKAHVEVDGQITGAINTGILAFIGVEKEDGPLQVEKMLRRLLNYRIFPDSSGKMNLSLQQTAGGLLLVSQFTLVADTRKGNRPSFSRAADPDHGRSVFHQLVECAARSHTPVETGIYAADMQVHLINDGPVTFWLQV